MPSKLTFEEQFKIRASEVDANQKATLPAICNLLQEIAGNHARQLQFDITDLQENKLTWVLHRLQVQMDRFPDWRETITIRTWPSGGDGLRAHRDFLILDQKENTIGCALSYWLILSIESRRPIRIPKEILDSVPKNSEHVLPVTDGSFEEISQPDASRSFNVRKTDLDLNKHVNNVRYIEWALACLPEEHKAHEIDIKFLGESVLDDTDIAEMQRYSNTANKSGFTHQIKRTSDQKILATACSN